MTAALCGVVALGAETQVFGAVPIALIHHAEISCLRLFEDIGVVNKAVNENSPPPINNFVSFGLADRISQVDVDGHLPARSDKADRTSFGVGLGGWKFVLPAEGRYGDVCPGSNTVGGRLSGVFERDLCYDTSILIEGDVRFGEEHIRPQLAFGALSGDLVSTKGNENSDARGAYSQKQKNDFADSGPELLYRKTGHAVGGVRHSLLGYEVFLSAISVAIAGLLTIGGAGWGATGLWTININRRRIWTGSALAGLGFLIMLGWAAWLLLY